MWRACADQYNICVDNSPKNFAKNVDKTSFATKKVIFWPRFLLKITASDKKAKKNHCGYVDNSARRCEKLWKKPQYIVV